MLFAPSFFSLSWQLLICRKSSLLTLNDCSLKDSTYSDSLSSSFLLTKHPATTLIASSSVCQCMFCIVSNLIALLSESLICVVVLWAIILMIVSLTRFPTNGFQFIFRVIELSVTTGQLLKFAQNTRRFLCPSHTKHTQHTHTYSLARTRIVRSIDSVHLMRPAYLPLLAGLVHVSWAGRQSLSAICAVSWLVSS